MSAGSGRRAGVRVVRTLWGAAQPLVAVDRAAAQGCWGVEAALPFVERPDELAGAVRDAGLRLVAQGHSDSYLSSLRRERVAAHVASVAEQAGLAVRMGAAFMNLHSGLERWGSEEVAEYLEGCAAVEREHGLPLVHETHRGRLLFSPWQTAQVLESHPSIRLNLDVSHWIVVAHSDLEREWDTVRAAAKRSFYLHARVGHDQGPQVADPRAPGVTQQWVQHHEKIWDLVAQRHEERRRGQQRPEDEDEEEVEEGERGEEAAEADKLGSAEAHPGDQQAAGSEKVGELAEDIPEVFRGPLIVCAEYGPDPYLPTHPFTGEPVAAPQDEVTRWAEDRLRERYNA